MLAQQLLKEVFHQITYLTDKVMAKVIITQVKSGIDRPENQKRTLVALGLSKLNRPVEKEVTPQIKGMINKVRHLIDVKEIQNLRKWT